MNTDTAEIGKLIVAWQTFLKQADWQKRIVGIEPKVGGCGKVYELENPIDRPNESFAIADMRGLEFSEPHKHNGETEVYVVLEGSGKIGLGSGEEGKVEELKRGVVIITPPNTPHCTYSPNKDLVLAVVNTPPFNANNVVTLDKNKVAMVRDLGDVPVLKKINAVLVKVPSIQAGLDFYREQLGLQLFWKTDTMASVHLGDGQLVMSTTLDPETNILVESVEHAAKVFEKAGGKVVSPPEDIDVGKVAVVEDVFGNRLTLVDFSKGFYTTDASKNVTGVAKQ